MNNNNSNNEIKNVNNNNNNENSDIQINNFNTTHTPSQLTHVPVRTLEYLNSMQLPIFLIANVFTGVINMTIETMYVTHTYAFLILIIY